METNERICYYKRSDKGYDCYMCQHLTDDRNPEEYNYLCTRYDAYLGKYRAKRCQACIDEFGDKHRFWKYETNKERRQDNDND